MIAALTLAPLFLTVSGVLVVRDEAAKTRHAMTTLAAGGGEPARIVVGKDGGVKGVIAESVPKRTLSGFEECSRPRQGLSYIIRTQISGRDRPERGGSQAARRNGRRAQRSAMA
jgi:hypothetical protein